MRTAEASLISTVLNESSSIESFLDSVARQSVVPAQVVVVDGGSTDDTVAIVQSWQPPRGCEVLVAVEDGAGISRGRNLAIELARHDLILVTDAGTSLNSNWVERMLAAFDTPSRPDVVSGFFHPTGNGFIERTIAFAVTPTLAEIDPNNFLPSSRSVAFTRAAWRSAGGYPEWLDYCEDLVFDLAMREEGMRFNFAPQAQVSWSARPSLQAFMKQYYRYARGDGKAGLWRKRHAIRYAAYIGGAVLALSALRSPWLFVPLFAGGSVYLSKTWRRIFTRRQEFGGGATAALAVAPIVVIAGDLAKMAGYPVGIVWRSRQPH